MTLRSELEGAIALDTIRYSRVWEDHLLLERGLQITPEDDVLSITSAGDNVLALLLAGPRSVTAIDLSPAQTALLELKVAAIRHLRYADFVTLLGADPLPADPEKELPAAVISRRMAIFEHLRRTLPPSVRDFWDARTDDIAGGVMACGRLERHFDAFRREHLATDGYGSVVARLLQCDDRRTRCAMFDESLQGSSLAESFRHHFGREMLAARGRSDAQFRHVSDVDVGTVFWTRFRRACTMLPVRGNFYLASFLTSRYDSLAEGPPYLRPTAHARLRTLLPRLRIETGSLEELVSASAPSAFSKANLSNIFEYVSEEHAHRLLQMLADATRAGGRLCYWNLLVPRASPWSLRHRLRPHRRRATALSRRDRAWFYGAFHIEEVLAA